MELESKKIFTMTDADSKETKKMRLTRAITENEDLLFKWSLLSSEMNDSVASILFKKIIDLYIAIRGFAFASGCVEFYKQAQNKTFQKKKALRKEVK